MRRVGLLLVVAAALVAAWLALRRAGKLELQSDQAGEQFEADLKRREASVQATATRDAPVPAPKAEPRNTQLRQEQRKRRAPADQLRRKLVTLYGAKKERAARAVPPPVRRMPKPVGAGNQAGSEQGAYIQTVVREQFAPVAGSCYEQLLERNPTAAGDVVLEFGIVGNDDLGGVVESVEVDEESTTLDDEEFVTCVRESMYTTMFDAPPEGKNSITVTYPFSFEP